MSLSLAHPLLPLSSAVTQHPPVGFALIKVPQVDCCWALCFCFGCKIMFTGSDQNTSLLRNNNLNLFYVRHTSCLTGFCFYFIMNEIGAISVILCICIFLFSDSGKVGKSVRFPNLLYLCNQITHITVIQYDLLLITDVVK